MIKTFSSDELLSIWRRRLGLDTVRTDCSVKVYEGIDLDDLLRRSLRQWYLDLLDSAPHHLLPVSDIASEATVNNAFDTTWSDIQLPASARRPLSVRLKGWNVETNVISHDEASNILCRMASPFGRPGPNAPLAIRRENGISATPASDSVLSVRVVNDPGEAEFILDESLLSTLPSCLPI